MAARAVLAAVLAATAPAGPHPNSVSRSVVVVDGATATVELAVQALTVIEELGFDADGDRELGPDELADALPAFGAYAAERFVLRSGGERVPAEVVAVEATREPPEGPFPMLGQWLAVELAYAHDAPLADLALEFRLFEATNAAHLDHATLVFNDEAPQRFTFALGARVWEHVPWSERRPRVVRAFARRGALDALGAWETLALLVALGCAAPRGRGAFVAAALAGLGALAGVAPGAFESVPAPVGFAGLAAALSAAYVATDALLRREPRAPLLEAGAFGVVHGLRLGAGAAPAVAAEPLGAAAAAGLTLGAAVLVPLALAVAALLGALPGRREAAAGEGRWLAPPPLRVPLAVAAAAAGFALFARRAGFF